MNLDAPGMLLWPFPAELTLGALGGGKQSEREMSNLAVGFYSISKAFLVARRLCFVALASGPDAFCRCQASMNHELRPSPLTTQASSVNRIHADKCGKGISENEYVHNT